MAKTSFDNIDTEIPQDKGIQSPVPVQDSSVVTDDFFNNSSGFDGEFERKDIRTPYLSLVHGVGELAKQGYTPGSIVFNGEIVVAQPVKAAMPPSDGVNITILAGYKELVEKISNDEFTAGAKARRFKTEAEARAAGLVTGKEARESGDEEAKTFYPALQAKVLVKGKPEYGFSIEIDGQTYALAALALGKGSWWGAGMTLSTFANEARMLKKPNYWASFQLFSKLESFKGSPNSVWSFKAQKFGKNSDAFVAKVKELGI